MESTESLPFSQGHASCFYPEPIQPRPHPPYYSLKPHFKVTLPSTPVFSKWYLSWAFRTKILYVTLLSPVNATCPAHRIVLELITRMVGLCDAQYRSRYSSLCNLLHSPVTSSLLGQNTFLSTLFSNTLCVCSSLSVRDQVSHPYKTTGKIIFPYIFILNFWTAN